MPQTTTSCPVLHNDLAPSYGKINRDRSDMIQPFTSTILHKTTDHSSASSTHRRRLTRVSPASRMPLADVCTNLVAYRKHGSRHVRGGSHCMFFHVASPCDSQPRWVTPALLQCPTSTSTQHMLEISRRRKPLGKGTGSGGTEPPWAGF